VSNARSHEAAKAIVRIVRAIVPSVVIFFIYAAIVTDFTNRRNFTDGGTFAAENP